MGKIIFFTRKIPYKSLEWPLFSQNRQNTPKPQNVEKKNPLETS